MGLLVFAFELSCIIAAFLQSWLAPLETVERINDPIRIQLNGNINNAFLYDSSLVGLCFCDRVNVFLVFGIARSRLLGPGRVHDPVLTWGTCQLCFSRA